MIRVTWAQLKPFYDASKTPLFHVERDDSYEIDCGPYHAQIPKDSGAEQTEFEEDYLALSNRPTIVRISQTLGEDNLSISPRGFSFEATAGGDSTHRLLIDEALAVRGGIILPDANAVIGDWIEVAIEDVDNVVGYGAGTILRQYVPRWQILPGQLNMLEDVSIGVLPVAGLYLRVIYHSVGGANVKCAMNLLAWAVG